MPKKTIFIPTGPLPAYIGFCDNEKAWRKILKHLNVLEPEPFAKEGACTSLESSTGELTILIQINRKALKKCTKLQIIGVAAHEASHAFDAVARQMDERNPSPEFKAYTIQWLTQTCLDKLKLL